jgi:alpha-galactosidase
LTVEAALTGKREHIYHAVMLDPHTATVLPLDKIWAMCDDLIAAHQKHGLLGNFAPTIPGTGRAFAGTGDRIFAEANVVTVKKGKMEAEIAVTNPRPKPITVDLAIESVGEVWGSNAGSKTLKIRVPAGKTTRKKISVPNPETAKEGFSLRLVSNSPDVFTRDYVMQKRRVLLAAEKGGAPFDLKLAGFPAVEASLSVQKRVISLRIAIEDSKIAPMLQRPWEGSGVELFFADIKGRDIRQIFVVPQANMRKVDIRDNRLKPISNIHATIGKHPRVSGYEMHIEVPFAAAGLAPGDTRFLFDAIVNLTALGDAHGGGRTSLTGRFDSHVRSDYFAQVEGD